MVFLIYVWKDLKVYIFLKGLIEFVLIKLKFCEILFFKGDYFFLFELLLIFIFFLFYINFFIVILNRVLGFLFFSRCYLDI